MARIRTIKPDFFTSRSLAKVSRDARLTFAGLWCEADDHGRGEADPRLLKGALWPLDDDIPPEVVQAHLDELEGEHIRIYTVNGEAFYVVLKWEKHQAAAYRRGEAKHPSPEQADAVDNPPKPPLTRAHVEACKEVHDAHECVLEGKGEEGKGRESSSNSQVTQTGAGDSRINDAIECFARMELDAAKAKGTVIRSESGFLEHKRKDARANPDLDRWLVMFPSAPASAVAGWLAGDKHSMGYYERVDEPMADVVQLRKEAM